MLAYTGSRGKTSCVAHDGDCGGSGLDLLETFSKNLLFVVAERVDKIVRKSGHRAERGDLKLDMLPCNSKVRKVGHYAAVVHDCRYDAVGSNCFGSDGVF